MKAIARTITALAIVIASSAGTWAASNPKFFKKAADRVWSTRNELFNPDLEIPDSISAGASAVVLADYNCVDADYEYYENLASIVNRTKRTYWTRRMVKLLDSKAVEDFSEFEFGDKERLDIEFITLGGSDNAFGARIYKPDGTVKNVDLNDAVDIKDNKKNGKNSVTRHKIAIPGLEPGDVLEYFDYTEEWIDDLDLPELNFIPVDKYPVMNYLLEGEFAPQLTAEYRIYNGLPEPLRGNNDKGDNGIFLNLTNVGVVKDTNSLRRYRQLPFLRLNTLNNTSRFRFYPMSKRRGGLYNHVSTGTIYRDIKYALGASSYDSNLPRRAVNLVNNFRKAHPEAPRNELVDAAWLATVYLNETDKESYSDYWLSVMFYDVIKKLGLTDGYDSGLGFINSRNDVPTDMIMSWRQPEFGALVRDSIYISSPLFNFLPGELPGDYQGEAGGAFPGDHTKLTSATEPTIFKVPTSRPAQNRLTAVATVAFDTDNLNATVDASLTFTGDTKSIPSGVTNLNEWAAAVEDYLGIPANKRYKDKKNDPEARVKEMNEVVKEIAGNIINPQILELDSFAIVQRGVVPGARELVMTADFKAEGAVTDAGNDLLLNIGRFIGDNKRLAGDDRTRQLDAFRSAPAQYNYDITFKIPEGYAVDEASLEALKANANNKIGAYFASAKTDDAGNVIVNIRERYNPYIISADNWPQYLEIADAAAAFNDAVLLIKKK